MGDEPGDPIRVFVLNVFVCVCLFVCLFLCVCVSQCVCVLDNTDKPLCVCKMLRGHSRPEKVAAVRVAAVLRTTITGNGCTSRRPVLHFVSPHTGTYRYTSRCWSFLRFRTSFGSIMQRHRPPALHESQSSFEGDAKPRFKIDFFSFQ